MGYYLRIPIDEVTQPKQGFVCITDCWWLVEDGCVLGFKLYGEKSKERPTPQCNDDRRIVDLALQRKPHQTAIFLPVAFWWPPEH